MIRAVLGAFVGVGFLVAAAFVALANTDDDRAGFLPYDNAAAIARGAEVYADNCATCHGADLEGQPNWKERDADGFLPAPPHDPDGHTWHHPDAQLFMITKFGTEAVVGNGYRSNMAAFGDVLDDADIVAVLAYIKSTWPDRVIEIHNKINADFDAQQK